MQYLWLYMALIVLVWWLYARRQRRVLREHAQSLQQSLHAGLAEPASLHPVVDPLRCLGSSSCVRACPEGALGVVDGKAMLVNGAACIGHGACKAACPVDAIELVFGTEQRGIDIPQVSPTFESNVEPARETAVRPARLITGTPIHSASHVVVPPQEVFTSRNCV